MHIQFCMSPNLNGPPTPKAYAYAEFPSVEAATEAIELLKDVEFQNVKLKVLHTNNCLKH